MDKLALMAIPTWLVVELSILMIVLGYCISQLIKIAYNDIIAKKHCNQCNFSRQQLGPSAQRYCPRCIYYKASLQYFCDKRDKAEAKKKYSGHFKARRTR